MLNNKSSGKPELKESTTEISVAKIALISAITVAVIGMIGTAVNAYFSSQAAQAPIIIPIQATQTAEAARLIPSSATTAVLPFAATATLVSSEPQPTTAVAPPKATSGNRCCPSYVLPASDAITSAAFSPDGQTLATCRIPARAMARERRQPLA